MRNFAIVVTAMLAVLFFFTAGGPEPSTSQQGANTGAGDGVGPAETFTWQGGQPISFQPPLGWQAGRFQQAGRNGVDYIKAGQRISVTEYSRVGALDGCTGLQDVVAQLETKNKRLLQRDLRVAVRNPRDVKRPSEAKLIRDLKVYTDKAEQALANDDFAGTRRQIDNALRTRANNRLSLQDYLPEVMYNRSAKGDLKRVEIGQPVDLTIDGEPATALDYEVDIRAQYATQVVEKTEAGRQLYVMSSNRLFVLTFQGARANLPLFEKVVNTVRFPNGPCSL